MMNRSLPLPLAVDSRTLTYEVRQEPLPPPPQLSPAELAQAYRDWRFGPRRAASCSPLSRRASQ